MYVSMTRCGFDCRSFRGRRETYLLYLVVSTERMVSGLNTQVSLAQTTWDRGTL